MTPSPIDYTRSRSNPWGLNARQCAALRLVCKHGNTKQVWASTDISDRTIQSNIEDARKLMGMRGHDVRFYLEWDRWCRTEGKAGATKWRPN